MYKYGVISGPCFPVFGPEITPYLDTFHAVQHKTIQSLAIELFKVEKRIANPISCDIFPPRPIDYDLRSEIDFSVSSVNTTHFSLIS